MNWVIGKKQKRRNRIKAQFGKNPMELEAWESLEKRMREIRMYEESGFSSVIFHKFSCYTKPWK